MTRTKPGESLTKRLAVQEQRARDTLADIATKRQHARDKLTGKTRAMAAAQRWLEALTATELAEQCKLRGFPYSDFDSMEEAIEAVLHSMFNTKLVLEPLSPSAPSVTVHDEDEQPLAFEG